MTRLDARWLFDPLDPDRFLSAHCDRAFLHVERRQPGYYAGLFDRAALGRILRERSDALAGRVYASAEGVMEHLPVLVPEGAAAWAEQAVAADGTLVVNGVSDLCPRVGELTALLGDFLEAPVHANAYLTPAGRPGHPAHFDCDDTLFLQIAGSKHWALHPGPVALPLASQFARIDPESLGWPLADVTLMAGDLLYVPRGLVHVAVTAGQDQDSLHLTLGLHHRLWRDHFLELAGQAALADERLRRAVSLGSNGLPDRALLEEVLEAFGKAVEAAGTG